MDRNEIFWIKMTDDEGEEISVGLLRMLEYNNKEYAAIVYEDVFDELLDEIDQDFEILRCDIDNNGEETLNEIEDMEEFDAVCEALFDIYDEELRESEDKDKMDKEKEG
jgi:uncharacterized protein YrzB (UPF0473 family)